MENIFGICFKYFEIYMKYFCFDFDIYLLFLKSLDFDILQNVCAPSKLCNCSQMNWHISLNFTLDQGMDPCTVFCKIAVTVLNTK